MKNNSTTNNFYHPKFILMWLMILIMRIVVFIPFHLQIIIAKPLGFLLKKLNRKKYKIVIVNIKKCFANLSKKEQNKIINQHFYDFAISLFEIANCFYMSPKRLKKIYTLDNLNLLQQHIKNKSNIMIIVGHFTTMIIAGRILADNINFADIYRPQNNKLFNYIMVKRFEQYGVKMISVRDSKIIIKTLKNGIPIWYAPDQDLGDKKSVFADFFNITTNTITATSKLAKSSNAQIIHFDFYRHKNGYNCKLANIENYPSNDYLTDANTINKILEKQILQAKSQYLWTHRRFKTRPKNEKSFYH